MPRPYRASGESHPGSLLRLALLCLGAALLAGIAEGLLSQWISLLLLFPIVIAGVVGATASKLVKSTHIRAPLAAAALAALAALAGQLTVEGTEYQVFRRNLGNSPEIRDSPAGGLSASDRDKLLDNLLTAQTGHAGFVGYLLMRAEVGTEIKKVGHSSGINLSGVGYWILFAVNFALAAGIAASMAWGAAREPYCESCQRWYDREAILARGTGDKQPIKALREALERGALSEVPRLLGTASETSSSAMHLRSCSNCAIHEPLLTLQVTRGAKNKKQVSTAYKTLLHPEEGRRLTEALTPPA